MDKVLDEQLAALLEGGDLERLADFLLDVPSRERKKLTPIVKQQIKIWRDLDNTSKPKDKLELLHLSALFCFSYDDYVRANFFRIGKFLWLFKRWAPDWLDKFLLNHGSHYGTDYEWVMILIEAGKLAPSPEIIAEKLPYYLFTYDQALASNKRLFDPQRLLKYPQTTQTHIGYLFTHTSNMTWVEGYEVQDVDPQPQKWKYSLAWLIEGGHLDRMEILRESLRATLRQFNKPLTNWFMDLFVYLKPALEELSVLQAELIQCLLCPQAKVVRIALNQLKKLIKTPDFQAEEIVNAAAPHLQSETKTLLKAALSLYEKIASQFPDLRAIMCEYLSLLFLVQDAKLQAQGAKFLLKYADPNDEVLQEQLQMLSESLLTPTKEALAGYLGDMAAQEPLAELEVATVIPPLDPSRELSMPDSVEDLVFLALRAMESDELSAQLLLPGAFGLWFDRLVGAELEKLGPLVQAACKLIQRGEAPSGSRYQQYLIHYVLAVIEKLIARSPEEGAGLQQIISKLEKQKRQFQINMLNRRDEIWERDDRAVIKVWAILLQDCLAHIDQRQSLLSSPSHEPYWLAPERLLERIEVLQQHDLQANALDLEIALDRIPTDSVDRLKALARERLNSDWQSLLDQHWAERNAEELGVSWELKIYDRTWHNRGQKEVYQVMEIGFETDEIIVEKPGVIKGIKKIFKREQTQRLTVASALTADKLSLLGAELGFAISLSPQQIEAIYKQLLGQYVNGAATYSSPEVDGTQIYKAGLNAMIDFPFPLGEMAQTFLGASFFFGEKSVRQLAAEIWNQKVAQQHLKPSKIGEVIGKLEYHEYGPLKRLTDLLDQNMLRLSHTHNLALVEMLEACFAELHPKPIRNLKRLLEIYRELLIATKRSPQEPKAISQLQNWQTSSSTKVIAKQILVL